MPSLFSSNVLAMGTGVLVSSFFARKLWSMRSSSSPSSPARSFPPRDDMPDPVYSSFDWKTTVVGGSYALHQFTGDTEWEPNDVDIMLACDDHDDFEQRARQFERKTGANLLRDSVVECGKVWIVGKDGTKTAKEAPFDENFAECVKATRTYRLPNFHLPLQLIFIKPLDGLTLPCTLATCTDVPSCVNFTVWTDANGNTHKLFHVPEKGREALLTRRARERDVCKTRIDKYRARGYDYY